MTVSAGNDVYYDPYDVELNTDPYPMFRRIRDAALHDFETFSSARGAVHDRFPEWEVDLTTAELSPTSTVRGWESMPAVIP